jgi:hypothetical protein
MAHLFLEQDPVGRIGEAAAKTFLRKSYLAVRKMDFKSEAADFECVRHNGAIHVWEIKTVKGLWDNYTIEVEQLNVSEDSRIPKHISHHNEINYMAYWDIERCELLVYKMEELYKFILANRHKAVMNNFGTAKIIFLPRHSINAGYCGTIKNIEKNKVDR